VARNGGMKGAGGGREGMTIFGLPIGPNIGFGKKGKTGKGRLFTAFFLSFGGGRKGNCVYLLKSTDNPEGGRGKRKKEEETILFISRL